MAASTSQYLSSKQQHSHCVHTEPAWSRSLINHIDNELDSRTLINHIGSELDLTEAQHSPNLHLFFCPLNKRFPFIKFTNFKKITLKIA